MENSGVSELAARMNQAVFAEEICKRGMNAPLLLGKSGVEGKQRGSTLLKSSTSLFTAKILATIL